MATTTLLDGAITAADTLIYVDPAAGFPSSPGFQVSIDDERLLIVGVKDTQWRVERGYAGTVRAEHSDDATVTLEADTAEAPTSDLQKTTPPVLTSTGVTPGTYGDPRKTVSFTVDAHGRLTAAAEYALRIPSTEAPTAADDPGTAGEIRYDGTHLYLCVGADSWIAFDKAGSFP